MDFLHSQIKCFICHGTEHQYLHTCGELKFQDGGQYGRQKTKCIAAHRACTKTNEEQISIIGRSVDRSIVVSIAWKCKFPRLRPIWPPKTMLQFKTLKCIHVYQLIGHFTG